MRIRFLLIVMMSVVLTACASNGAVDGSTGSAAGDTALEVSYSRVLPNGAALKEEPKEVSIVRRKNTQNHAAAQIGINIVSLALGGGVSVNPFSKSDLKGDSIEGSASRRNLANPIPTTFVRVLREDVDRVVQSNAGLKKKAVGNKLIVSGGSSRLIYEKLNGSEEERFRLNTELYVWVEQKGFHVKLQGPKRIDCSQSSDLLTQAQWANNDYQLVKTRLDAVMRSCQQKVVSQLPSLLDKRG